MGKHFWVVRPPEREALALRHANEDKVAVYLHDSIHFNFLVDKSGAAKKRRSSAWFPFFDC